MTRGGSKAVRGDKGDLVRGDVEVFPGGDVRPCAGEVAGYADGVHGVGAELTLGKGCALGGSEVCPGVCCQQYADEGVEQEALHGYTLSCLWFGWSLFHGLIGKSLS